METPRVLSPSLHGSHNGGARPVDGTFHPGGDQALVGHAATAESTGRLCLSFLFNSHSDLVRPSSLNINTGPERPTVSLRRAEPHARPSPRSLQPAEGVLAPPVTQGTPRSSALFRLTSDTSSFLLFHVRWCRGRHWACVGSSPERLVRRPGQDEWLSAPGHTPRGAPVTQASTSPRHGAVTASMAPAAVPPGRPRQAGMTDRTRLTRASLECQPQPAQPEREAQGDHASVLVIPWGAGPL